jgi:hypothetical protein
VKAQQALGVSGNGEYLDQVVFKSFFFKGQTMEGGCDSFNGMCRASLELPIDSYYFNSISTSFEYRDLRTDTVSTLDATCSDAAAVQGITRSLQLRKNHQVECAGKTWKVFKCSGSMVTCVNCASGCTSCPSSDFVVNPCRDCAKDNFKSAFQVLRFDTAYRSLFPTLTYESIVSNQFSIDIVANVSKPGTMYCAAFDAPYTLASTSALRQRGKAARFETVDSLVSLTLPNLLPQTDYDVYCSTEDFNSHAMYLIDIEPTKRTVSTACCRGVLFTKSMPQVDVLTEYNAGLSIARPVFELELNAKPSRAVTVRVTAGACDGYEENDFPDVSIVPNIFSFNPASISLLGSFRVSSNNVGCVRLGTVNYGGDDYESDFADVLFVDDRDILPTPSLTGAVFAYDGRAIDASFDIETDRAFFTGAFACNRILSFSGARLATCSWTDDRTLRIFLGTLSMLVTVGDTISVVPGILKAGCIETFNCDAFEYTMYNTTLVTAPEDVIVPVVSMSTSTAVSSCDDIIIDVTGSFGDAGRGWQRVFWELKGDTPSNATAIAMHLNDKYMSTTGEPTIPSDLLLPGHYSIALSLTNFLGRTSTSQVDVEVQEVAYTPKARIIGPNVLTFARGKGLNIFVEATLPQCASAVTERKLTYEWRVYKDIAYLEKFASTSVDARVFKLAPYSLDAGTRYTLMARVATVAVPGQPSIATVSTVTLNVLRSGVTAVIYGGIERRVGMDVPLLLDASGSYDEDYPELGHEPLSFDWSCVEESPAFGNPCGKFFQPQGPYIHIAQGKLVQKGQADKVYLFTVRVSNADNSANVVSQIIHAERRSIPNVVIPAMAAKMRQGKRLLINATVEVKQPVWVEWVSPDLSSTALGAVAVTPLTQALPVGMHLLQLGISPDASFSPGMTYRFELRAAFDQFATVPDSTASISMKLNQPPQGGHFKVTPATGSALNSTYSLRASKWVDDPEDYPLSYAMSYYTGSATEVRLLKDLNEVAVVRTFLGQGLESLDYAVSCILRIADVLLSEATVTYTVTVTPFVADSSSGGLFDILNSNIQESGDSGNAELAGTVMDIVTESINTADCSGVSKNFCPQLHRESCSSTAGTCGLCKPGYTGVDYHSNTLCREETADARRRLQSDEGPGRPGASCFYNRDCISNICTKQTKTCEQGYAECPNDCSGNGECGYVDQYGNELQRVDCRVEDPFCRAQCVCDASSFGADCSLNRLERIDKEQMREVMCSTSLDMVSRQDATQDVMTSRSMSLAALLLDVTQLTDEAFEECTDALTQTILANPSGVAEDERSFRAVLQALSTVLERGSSVPDRTFNDFSTALTRLALARQAVLAIDEPGTDVILRNFRMHVSKRSAQSLAVAAVNSPRTMLESLLNAPSASIVVRNVDADEVLGVNMVLFHTSPRPDVTNSTPVRFETIPYSGDSYSITTEVVLVNPRPIDYFMNYPEEQEVTCNSGIGMPQYNFTLTCPNNVTRELACDGGKAEVYDVMCPGEEQKPVCLRWNNGNGGGFEKDPLCRVSGGGTAYSGTNTTCECLPDDDLLAAESRRLDEIVDGNVRRADYAASLQLTISALEVSYFDYSFMPTQADAVVIMWAMVAFLFAAIAGFIGVLGVDIQETRRLIKAKDKALPTRRTARRFFTSALPSEFSNATHVRRWWDRMCEKHTLVSLMVKGVTAKNTTGTRRPFYFIVTIGRVLNLVALNTFLALWLYRDDGNCQARLDQEACFVDVDEAGMFGLERRCEWNSLVQYCDVRPDFPGRGYCADMTTVEMCETTYSSVMGDEQRCAWDVASGACDATGEAATRLDADFFWSLLALLMVSAVAVIPLNMVITKCVEKISKHFVVAGEESKKHIYMGRTLAERRLADELTDWQTQRSTFLRAARLRKMKDAMDFVPPVTELIKLLRGGTDRAWPADKVRNFDKSSLPGRVETVYNNIVLPYEEPGNPEVASKVMHYSRRETHELALEMLQRARARADEMANDLRRRTFVQNRDVYLLQEFLGYLLSGYKQRIAQKVFREYRARFATPQSAKPTAMYYVSWVVVVVQLCYATAFISENTLGKMATPTDTNKTLMLWLLACVLGFLLDLFFTQPVRIWISHITIPGVVRDDLLDIVELLKERSQFVLRRTTGVMRCADSLIQHYNPAVRAARALPSLPVSRILISLGDYDLKSFKERTLLRKAGGYWSYLVGAVLTPLTRLPFFMNDALIELFTVCTAGTAAWGLYLLAQSFVLALTADGGTSVSEASTLVVLAIAGSIIVVSLGLLVLGQKDPSEKYRNDLSLPASLDEVHEEDVVDEKPKKKKPRGKQIKNLKVYDLEEGEDMADVAVEQLDRRKEFMETFKDGSRLATKHEYMPDGTVVVTKTWSPAKAKKDLEDDALKKKPTSPEDDLKKTKKGVASSAVVPFDLTSMSNASDSDFSAIISDRERHKPPGKLQLPSLSKKELKKIKKKEKKARKKERKEARAHRDHRRDSRASSVASEMDTDVSSDATEMVDVRVRDRSRQGSRHNRRDHKSSRESNRNRSRDGDHRDHRDRRRAASERRDVEWSGSEGEESEDSDPLGLVPVRDGRNRRGHDESRNGRTAVDRLVAVLEDMDLDDVEDEDEDYSRRRHKDGGLPMAGPGAQPRPDTTDNYGGLDSGFLFSTTVERDSRDLRGQSAAMSVMTGDLTSGRSGTAVRAPGQRDGDNATEMSGRDHHPLFY